MEVDAPYSAEKASTFVAVHQHDPLDGALAHKAALDTDTESSSSPPFEGKEGSPPAYVIDPNSSDFGRFDEHGRELPPWREQLTVRAIVIAACIGVLFNLMVMKLGFTVGIIPSLNIAAGLLGFVGTKGLILLAARATALLLNVPLIRAIPGLGNPTRPFTRQENTVIQTCVVACYGLAFSGGFTNYLVAMDWNSYLAVEGGTTDVAGVVGQPPQDLPVNVVEPSLGRFYAFMFVIYFIGIFALTPLRKVFILDYRLTYPSGTATGVMVNGFHTPLGSADATRQVKCLAKWFSASFLWSMFKWMFSGFGDSCGFDNFPSLGLRAYHWLWYFDFSQTYVGIGMICPVYVTYSIMFGAVISWGILWPIVNTKAGDWYPAKYGQGSSNITGLYGYKIFVSVAIILGDGLYNIVKITFITIRGVMRARAMRRTLPVHTERQLTEKEPESEEERQALLLQKLRDTVFMKDAIPSWLTCSAYVCLAAISIGVTPQIFPQVKAYYVLVAYLIAPVFAFCNAYGMGLTDWSLLTTYGKVCIFIFSSWAGPQGGIVAGLAMCGIMCTIVGSAADLMQDFKTGYLTLSSPRSMFIAQLCGALLACIIAPAVFWLYWTGFIIGDPNGEYKAPFAAIFRSMAVLAVEGSGILPRYCGVFCIVFFIAAAVLNVVRDHVVPGRFKKYVPIAMAMAIPFYLGPYFAIDMSVGAVILVVWGRVNKASRTLFAPIIASALIAGDGVWTVPSAILALAKVHPPICMWFFSTDNFQANFSDLPQYGT